MEQFIGLLRPVSNAAGVVLAFVGAVALLIPQNVLSFLGLQHHDRSWFGLALLFGMAMMIAVQLSDPQSMLQQLRASRAGRKRKKVERDELCGRISRLTDEEKALVWTFQQGKTAIWLDAQHPVANGLAAQEILIRTGVNGMAYEVAYSLQPWVRELLLERPELTGSQQQNRTP